MNKCYQCGWFNPDDTDLCQKCGQPVKTARRTSSPISLRTASEAVASCCKCGYPRSSLLTFCPWCGDGKVLDGILSNSQSKLDVGHASSMKPMGQPYLEMVANGTTEIIPLLDSQKIILQGIVYIYHHQ